MTKCPRCGEPMTGGVCNNCGFPVTRFKKIAMPVIRNGKQATVGYQPEVWKKWE